MREDRTISKIFNRLINRRNWIDLAQDTDYWKALVIAVLKFRVPYAIELVPNSNSYITAQRYEINIWNKHKE